MKRLKILITAMAASSSAAINAQDGWYDINNYQGFIGNSPVHFSIQHYRFGDKTNLEGVYYYDDSRQPIPIYGVESSGSVNMCEVTNKKEYDDYLVYGNKYHHYKCPFKLIQKNNSLRGEWSNANKFINVRLTKTASFNQRIKSEDADGSIEVPFWGQTDTHSFIGIYEKSGGGIAIHKIKVVNKKTGRTDQLINPQLHGCDFGFYMTAVYQNIENNGNASGIILNCYSTGPDVNIGYHYNISSNTYQASYK